MPQWVALLILALVTGALAFLVPLALHRTSLLILARRERTERGPWVGPLPPVTVQLPVFNEMGVVERLLDAAAGLDYPKDLLDIQLLDDSTDQTTTIADECVRCLRRQGVRVEHLRRPGREGFKAGALAHGLERAEGAFILVLDADFVPGPNLIHQLLGPFLDPGVGMVQARWDHLNESRSLLTRCQALLLDAHFFFEQGGRAAAGRFINFNGTAGMWRRVALEEAGGWSSDTLTEDLDVSYRAQMAGWRFAFLPGVGVPAEIPEDVRSVEVQQKRWAQGGIETGRKILPALVRGPWPPQVKIEAAVHLLGHFAHPCTLLLGILLLPSALARQSLGLDFLLIFDLLVFAGATLSVLLYYSAAGRRRRRSWMSLVPTALLTMALAIGLTATVSSAVLRGAWAGGGGVFHRTPKRGRGPERYASPKSRGDLAIKLIVTTWMLISAAIAVQQGYFATLPFIVLFGGGFGWLTAGEVWDRFARLRQDDAGIRSRVPDELGAVAPT